MDSNAEQGARLLFFSGGTALGAVATALTRFTHNAVHVITTFDSGGSSATLRQAFHMPAVGDVRARIMALADVTVNGNPELVALFGHRLPMDTPPSGLRTELAALAQGQHPLIRAVPDPLRQIVMAHLKDFQVQMPEDLDLAGASIGNLVLTAGYLAHAHQLEPVATIFSKLVQALGVVRPVVNDDAHLCVELENGERIIGQHRFTGKTAHRISSPIKDMWLTRSLDDPAPITLCIRPRLAELIRQADLICYPVGSFYSSVLANLLPQGVSEAIHAAPCPKVFIPNLGTDPELFGLSVQNQVERLLAMSKEAKSAGEGDAHTATHGALDALLVDSDATRYPGGIPQRWLAAQGIRVYRLPLVVTPPFL
ncbi:MAG: GAK system CofD-like protein, partial [Bilophila sp.]